jgi:hypothetical protein
MVRAWAIACASDDCWTEKSVLKLRELLPGAVIVTRGTLDSVILVVDDCSREELDGALVVAKGARACLEIREQEIEGGEHERLSTGAIIRRARLFDKPSED